MPAYSAATILYIICQVISVILLLLLIYNSLKSESYSKWTMLQMFISALGGGLTGLPLAIMYGDDVAIRAFETPLCIIVQKISAYFQFPMQFFSCALMLYLWCALVKGNRNIEMKYSKYVSILIWIYTTVYNGILLIYANREVHWGVWAGIYNCKNTTIVQSYYGYVIPSCVLTFFSFILTCHSASILYKRWSTFNMIKNRTTAIKLGEAIRLCIWCVTYIILVSLSFIPRILQGISGMITGNIENFIKVASFDSALIGSLLFLIFGTDRRAAIFLPCYYSPPEKSRMQFPSFPDENVDIRRLSNVYLDQTIDKDYCVHYDNCTSYEEDSDSSGSMTQYPHI